jgi:hypothetical protein
MTAPSAPDPELRPLPATRKEAIALLVAAEYDLALLSPEEIAAVRTAFHLPGRGSANSGGQHGEE